MRRNSHRFVFVTLAATALALVAWMSVASASALLTERFNYVNGNLETVGTGWYIHSGSSGLTSIPVSDLHVLVNQGATSRPDYSKQFPGQTATSKTYVSLFLTVPSRTLPNDAANVLTSDDYFTHVKSIGADSTGFKARVYVGAFAGGDYTVGISVTSSGTSPVVKWASALTYGVTYLIVYSYDAATGTAELWVNPADETSTKIVSTNAAAIGTAVAAACLRQGGGATTNTSTQIVDDLRVGTSFADVTTPVIPASGNWGLALMALLMAGVGTAFVLRRRQVA